MVAAQRIDAIPAGLAERLERRRCSAEQAIWALLDDVMDPEVPVLSLWDLGVLQDVRRDGDQVTVVLTPTYVGCPALRVMEDDVRTRLARAGHLNVSFERRLSPPWTTDWLSSDARRQLHDYGIAPPGPVACPQCDSARTSLISEFGSTACKALYRCDDCGETFDHFKRI